MAKQHTQHVQASDNTAPPVHDKTFAKRVIDSRELRQCLGHFATGVTVVTCEGDGINHGATVNAFSALSLDPPLVLVAVDRRSRICGYLEHGAFTVNVLGEPQNDIALHFAGKPMADTPRWERPDPTLAPQLAGVLVTVACSPWRSYDGGDHMLYLGEVRRIAMSDAAPLVFYRGAFRHLGPAFEVVPWLASGDCPEVSWI